MSDIFMALIGILLLLCLIGLPIYTIQTHKRKIEALLESRGAMNIAIEYLPLTLDRTNYSYEVSYHDANGKFHMTKCKMSMIDSTMYWKDEDQFR